MHDGLADETERVSINIPDKHVIDNGDVLFSWSATLEVIHWHGGKAGLNQHIFKVVPTNEFPIEYIYHQLSDYVITFRKLALARKTTMGHITADHIYQSRIVIATLSIVKEYERIVEPLYKEIDSLQRENIKLASLRDYLLPLLMNGRATISD